MNNLLDLIGNTPIVQLKNYPDIFVKLEGMNPFGSVKDRTALYLIREGEKEGKLESGKIVEPTSGNTGIALAYIGRYLGYRVTIVMPDTMSEERIKLLKLAGAEVILTPGERGMEGAIKVAGEKAERERAYFPDQFSNPANPLAHFETTAPEIFSFFSPDFIIAGIGTGGTITGIGEFVRENNIKCTVVGVEPEESPVISRGISGTHGIQGIGAGFIPAVLNLAVVNDILTVTTEEAFKFTRYLFKYEGIIAGISSGAALAASIKIAEKYRGKKVLAILPDRGDRYLSVLNSENGTKGGKR